MISMRIFSLAALSLLLLAAPFCSANDLSKYPCTVFSSNICFRLPAGTQVAYSIPVDFHLFVISNNSEPVATVYVGNAPQKEMSGELILRSKSKSGVLEAFSNKSSEVKKLDIYITPSARDASVIHIHAEDRSSTHDELQELLSSFRPCTPIRSGGQKCPISDIWSQELAQILAPSQ